MEKSLSLPTKLLILLLGLPLTSQAYTFKEENKPIAAQQVLREATQLGLGTSRNERQARREIRSWSDKTIKNHLESAAPDPLLLEIKNHTEFLGQAKVIARHQIYKAVQKNWGKIRESSLNEIAATSFDKYEPYLKRELDKIEYVESRDKKGFLFTLPWADARVDAKLKKVSWVIHIGSHLDANRLQEGVDKIVIPERTAE